MITEEEAKKAWCVVKEYIRQIDETILTYSGVPANTRLDMFSWRPSTAKIFKKYDIRTIGDLISFPRKAFYKSTEATYRNMKEIDKFLNSLGIDLWV